LELFLLGPLLRGLLGLLVGTSCCLSTCLMLFDLVDAGVGLIYGFRSVTAADS
jgi:hypothetical protein